MQMCLLKGERSELVFILLNWGEMGMVGVAFGSFKNENKDIIVFTQVQK